MISCSSINAALAEGAHVAFLENFEVTDDDLISATISKAIERGIVATSDREERPPPPKARRGGGYGAATGRAAAACHGSRTAGNHPFWVS